MWPFGPLLANIRILFLYFTTDVHRAILQGHHIYWSCVKWNNICNISFGCVYKCRRYITFFISFYFSKIHISNVCFIILIAMGGQIQSVCI